MTKFRKKPVVIEAVQFDGSNMIEIFNFIGKSVDENIIIHNLSVNHKENKNYCSHISIPTLEGQMRADPGDWIIKGIKGEFYPCKPDIFEQTYDFTTEEKVAEIKISEIQKVNLKEGDVFLVTIKDDDVDFESLQCLKVQFGKVFCNNKVAVLAVGSDDDIKFSIVTEEK